MFKKFMATIFISAFCSNSVYADDPSPIAPPPSSVGNLLTPVR